MTEVLGLSDGDLKQKMLRQSKWPKLHFQILLNQNQNSLFI